jgi:hypothetical protein
LSAALNQFFSQIKLNILKFKSFLINNKRTPHKRSSKKLTNRISETAKTKSPQCCCYWEIRLWMAFWLLACVVDGMYELLLLNALRSAHFA